jgi:hypothetical protein
VGSSCEKLSPHPWCTKQGGQRDCHVAPMYQSGEGRVTTPVARHLRRRSSEPADLATYLLVQASQPVRRSDSSLRLFYCDDALDASPGLTIPTRSWFPTTLLLAVAVTAHALAALRREEATFCRELDTPSSPKTHFPVGYRWQNSGCCRLVPRASAQLHRRPRVAPERHSSAAAAAPRALER